MSAIKITTQQAIEQLEQSVVNLLAAQEYQRWNTDDLCNTLGAQAEILREIAYYMECLASEIRQTEQEQIIH